MRAECPQCKTSYLLDNILEEDHEGTIVCAVCQSGFDIKKHITNIDIVVKTYLRANYNEPAILVSEEKLVNSDEVLEVVDADVEVSKLDKPLLQKVLNFLQFWK